ncbi:Nif3-like dinuclear metal center hexameric protein [Rhodococcoides corynebacterioides]|uniref:GTP cyclohydrolase 1 type 2 homolog n=1 Tax=Rhodococcoides corynebacterioides TaxID=53972 RepID=A0ABS7P4F4_9NOCA|nr:Nif3-like dinuclear metal center hexameric protein [Rhodococcus corynebacterioides]MBY6367308.1 Nif3-like dinuclear metal center hexameric protein [Rhodococcus corynebacterioides]MBY6408964.1 Nif3-like dinuclear metal center hexameric protein [Rhodococcus corynebacterioides]
MTSPRPALLSDVIAELDRVYPPALAEDWDSVGLVAGDPTDEVRTVRFAVDATEAVVDRAIADGAELLVVHHPLLLRGVDTVGAHTPKGALIHRLVRAGCALFTAHTNADSARPGVSDALADALGLVDTAPLDPKDAAALDKWVVFVPDADAAAVREALFAAGAGALGDYRECSWATTGVGQFRPVDGANPTLGSVGSLEHVDEHRVETVAPRSARSAVLAALRAAHPYEEPAFDVFAQVGLPGPLGLGRVGRLEAPVTLREFTARVAERLPATAWGVRAAGDPDLRVERVAVCGGSGDSYLGAARAAGADVYVTSDLRHHVADEHLRGGGPALIDVAHWAGEFPWCAQARGVLDRAFGERPGWSSAVLGERTDPWTIGAVDTGR